MFTTLRGVSIADGSLDQVELQDYPDDFQNQQEEIEEDFVDSEEDISPLIARQRVYQGDVHFTGPGSIQLGDNITNNIKNYSNQIHKLYIQISHKFRSDRRGRTRRVKVENDPKNRQIRVKEVQQPTGSYELSPLTTVESQSSDDTLAENVPWDWLSEHIVEDLRCKILDCNCECHRSKRVTTEWLLVGRTKLKAGRFQYGHKCEQNGDMDYIKSVSIWFPEWMAVKRLIEFTNYRSEGFWWLPNLPKLVGDQAIFHFASTGDLEAMKLLLSRPPKKSKSGCANIRFDPNVIRQENGWTPLHFALEAGQYDVCHELIRKGARPNMETSSPSTAAYLAATRILVHHSNLEVRTKLTNAFHGELEYERFNFSKLHKIVVFKPDDAVRQIDNLVKAELAILIKSIDRAGKTPLCWAAHLNRGDVVRRLLQEGADITHQDFSGNSPFHFASQAVGPFALRVLRDHNQVKNEQYVGMKNKGGWQPLHHAAHYQKDARFAKRLVKAGACVDARTNAGKTPMMMAALMRRPEVIQFLSKRRANVNLEDRAGWTALSLAIDNVAPSLATIDALLDAQVSLKGESIRQDNILHLVAKKPHLDLIKHLISKAGIGANRLGYVNVQARNLEGATPEELLSAQKSGKEVVDAFRKLQSLMNAREAAVVRLRI